MFRITSTRLLAVKDNVASEAVTLILARGGSRGVKLKNLQTVGGKSLLSYAINAARAAHLRDVTVSTDHPLIALEALRSWYKTVLQLKSADKLNKFHVENEIFVLDKAKIFRRSKVTATDCAPSIWGALEFLASRPNATVLVLLQATSPFTRPSSVRGALSLLVESESLDCVFSVTRSHKLRWHEVNGKIVPQNFKTDSRPRRQDWEGELLETGGFYITRRNIVEQGYFQNNKRRTPDYCAFINVHRKMCAYGLDKLPVDQPLRTVTVQIEERVLEEIFREPTTSTTCVAHSPGMPKSIGWEIFKREDLLPYHF
ncbi:N-acylneuraminate cytidylyltransferase A [Eumeta japonica]|uniref:N-acylneuraminate cytidylyltransferase A n=1 Tax=Eumeta variegata TaxID=151549 RepID=A0A4C1VMK2_EUMVA|nr:N-acylneuraminate cytidylyltransferase A [Eumeta japonica]